MHGVTGDGKHTAGPATKKWACAHWCASPNAGTQQFQFPNIRRGQGKRQTGEADKAKAARQGENFRPIRKSGGNQQRRDLDFRFECTFSDTLRLEPPPYRCSAIGPLIFSSECGTDSSATAPSPRTVNRVCTRLIDGADQGGSKIRGLTPSFRQRSPSKSSPAIGGSQ
jgi:hypothetical protein